MIFASSALMSAQREATAASRCEIFFESSMSSNDLWLRGAGKGNFNARRKIAKPQTKKIMIFLIKSHISFVIPERPSGLPRTELLLWCVGSNPYWAPSDQAMIGFPPSRDMTKRIINAINAAIIPAETARRGNDQSGRREYSPRPAFPCTHPCRGTRP